MFQAFRIPISWYELGKRTVNETIEDDVTGLAAQLAYYFFLALFPALLFLVALASYFPVQDLMNQVTGALARFAPGEVLTIVKDQLGKIAGSQNGGLLTIGFVGTIWSTSSAISGVIDTLNHAYEIPESRPWWKVKLISIGLTLAVGLFILISFALVVAGPKMAEPLANWIGLGHAFAVFWRIIQWPIVFLLVVTGIGMIYYFGPDAEQHWEWITPGSLAATVLWILGSLGFRFYVVAFGNFNATYGTIGGVIVAMLWLYISGLAILVGAELNAEIENASPWGKEKGEKHPGEKRKLGRLAAAAYRAVRGGRGANAGRPAPDRPTAQPPGVLPSPIPQAAAAFAANTSPTQASAPPRPGTEATRPTPPVNPANPPRRRAADRVRLSDWIVGGAALAAELALALRSMRTRVKG
jgi:membrane protein